MVYPTTRLGKAAFTSSSSTSSSFDVLPAIDRPTSPGIRLAKPATASAIYS
jgi:hypothetical protein